MKAPALPGIARLLALLLALATFGLTAAVSRSPFERLPHLEDEIAYLYQARIFAGGNLVIPTPEPRISYWQPFVVDYEGRRFGKYPPGWPLLLSVGVLLGQPWVVNAFLATLAVALTYRLGRELFDAETGVVAALLTAISPTFLLLSGSLMAHTAALWWGALLAFALLRLERTRRARWAALGGLALGMLVNTRPLTALGLALPFTLAAGLSLLRGVGRALAGPGARGLPGGGGTAVVRLGLAFAVAAGVVSALTPIYNQAAVGDPLGNLYTLVWEYDRLGFGPCCGRTGHTPEKALRNLRFDLALWSSDLFGWQMSEATHGWLQTHTGWWLGQGLSWAWLPVGLAAARRKRWAWLLAGMFAGLVGVHLLYWIGAQTYSARYYSEAIPALALLSAAGVTAAARRASRLGVYVLLSAMVTASLFAYTPERLAALWRFNNVGGHHIEALEALRDGRPALILVTGKAQRSWRDWGTFMALTSPYLDSELVAARDHGLEGEREAILERFPGRQVLYLLPDGTLQAGEASLSNR